ncbi:MAG: Trm112 family protein [Planctomycetota bacterium]
MNKKLLDILACPWCLGDLDLAGGNLTCRRCRTVYTIEDDIPNMLVPEARVFCPLCHKEMEKIEEYACCAKCGRKFSMEQRIEGNMSDHAEPYAEKS